LYSSTRDELQIHYSLLEAWGWGMLGMIRSMLILEEP
jgi:hypothetical protein